jgi:hypothetical protein
MSLAMAQRYLLPVGEEMPAAAVAAELKLPPPEPWDLGQPEQFRAVLQHLMPGSWEARWYCWITSSMLSRSAAVASAAGDAPATCSLSRSMWRRPRVSGIVPQPGGCCTHLHTPVTWSQCLQCPHAFPNRHQRAMPPPNTQGNSRFGDINHLQPGSTRLQVPPAAICCKAMQGHAGDMQYLARSCSTCRSCMPTQACSGPLWLH